MSLPPPSRKRSGLIERKEIKSEAEFLDGIQTKVLRVFLLAIHSHLYRFALRSLFLQTHTTSYSVLLYTVKEKGRKPDGLRYPYRKYENSQLCPGLCPDP
jgi:hypothetical protein